MPFSPTPFNDNKRLKASDWQNIVVFILASLVLGYLFDAYIMKPKQQAMLAAREAQKAAIAVSEPVVAPRPRLDVLKDSPRLEITNADIDATISLQRGRIDDLSLKNYFTALDKKQRIDLLSPAGSDHPFYTETGWVTHDPALPMPDKNTVWSVTGQKTDRSATISWDNGAGLRFTRTFTLDDKYMVQVTDAVENMTTKPVKLWPYAAVMQQGLPEHLTGGIVHEGAIGYVGEEMLEHSYRNWADLIGSKAVREATTGWLGITGHYFFVGMIPDQKEQVVYRVTYLPPMDSENVHDKPVYQVDIRGQERVIEPGATKDFSTRLFAGPKQLRLLESYEDQLGLTHFDLTVDYGWFYFLTKPLYFALSFINDIVGNFGVAIIILTCLLRLAVFPLANTSFRSFAKMKLVGPQIQELQKTYAHDKRRMQEELVKLYEKEKVNPLSGCLPIIAQIPIFFAMYKVISVAIEMRHAPFFGWIQDLSAPDPTSLFNLYGLLPYDVHNWLHFGIWPTLLFFMIMIQVRLSPPPPDKMMYIFFQYYYPVVVCFIMAKFAAGLVIYWAFSSFLSIVQQIVIMRSLNVPVHLFEQMPWVKKKRALEPLVATTVKADVIEAEVVDAPSAPALPDHVTPKNKKK